MTGQMLLMMVFLEGKGQDLVDVSDTFGCLGVMSFSHLV